MGTHSYANIPHTVCSVFPNTMEKRLNCSLLFSHAEMCFELCQTSSRRHVVKTVDEFLKEINFIFLINFFFVKTHF